MRSVGKVAGINDAPSLPQDFMSRVRSWLTPSAWWTTSTQGNHGRESCPSSADSSLNVSGGHQLEQPPTSHTVSSRQSQMEAGPSSGMGTGPSSGMGTGLSIGMGTGPSSGLGTGPSSGVGTGPSSGMEAGPSMGIGPGGGMELGPDPMNQSHESEESWVAEASDEEDATGVRVDLKRQEKTDTRPNYSELARDLLEPAFHESMSRSSATNLFHPVERVANPSAKRSINSNKITSLFSSRLYSTDPLTTSTPQLSPVHEDNVSLTSITE